MLQLKKTGKEIKRYLTVEQSQHLLDLGVSFADASSSISTSYYGGWADQMVSMGIKYIFTLADLLRLLPEDIECVEDPKSFYPLYMISSTYGWAAYYGENRMGFQTAPELIDALYKLLVWCIEHHCLTLKKPDDEID